MENRYRTNLKKVYLSDQELIILDKNLAQSQCPSFSHYARKTLLDPGILYVARRMGHADKSTTLNTYSYWFNALDKTVFEEITQNIKSAGLDSILCQNSCQTSNL